MDLGQGSGNMANAVDSTAAAGPRWVLLNRYGDNDVDDHSEANAKTTAASCTLSGRPFSVSFTVATPPASSSFRGDWVGIGTPPPPPPHRDDDDGDGRSSNSISSHKHSNSKDLELNIVAAHDDSVLIEMREPHPDPCRSRVVFDYFLYEAGAGRTPPSLSLLPGCYVSNQFERDKDARQVPTRRDEARNLSCFKNTGILRHGDGEVLVAQLEVGHDVPFNTAELCVLRPGAMDWVLRRLPIVHHMGEEAGEVRHWTRIDATVPVGSHFICWVDYLSGFLLCDMAEENENPKLRYVPLPALPPKPGRQRYGAHPPYMQYCRNFAAAGPNAVRLVSVAPRCCCGGPGQTSCERSSSAFNITTWTMTLSTEEPMAWVMDGVLDCDELWQLPNYGRLPRVAPQFPIVSCDDPDIVCFTISQDSTVWMVEISTRSKALLSAAVRSDKNYYVGSQLVPVKLHW